MRKTLLSLSLLVMTAMAAMAQYKVEITSDPIETYTCEQQVEFAAEEIATALGLEVAELQSALTWEEGVEKEGVSYILIGEDKSNTYTGNFNEWWMTMDGTPVGYGADAVWFAGVGFVTAETAQSGVDVVNFYVGQMPGVFKKIYEPSVLTATLFLKNGDKEVQFDVTLNVNPATPSAIEAPATSYAALEIVKEYEMTIDYILGKSYEGKTESTILDGIYEALGVESADLDASVADVVVTRAIEKQQDESGNVISCSFSDVLDTPENLAGGAWFGRYSYFNEETSEDVTVTPNAPMGWGAGTNTIYTQDFKLSEGEFSLITGQFPGQLKLGDEDVVELFICNGTKAAKLTIHINVVEPEALPFDEMTKAGEAVVEVTATIDNGYVTKPFSIDMAAILEALGTEEVADFYGWASEGVLSDEHNENSGGFFYNSNGYICAWGNTAACFIARTTTSLEDGNFSIGQMPGGYFANVTEPTTISVDMVFVNADKYYIVTVNYTVKPEEQKGDDFEYTKVGEESIVMQIEPSATDWEWGVKTDLDMEYIESKIGTADITIMTDKMKDVKDEDGNVIGHELVKFDKSYSCDPKPGFWFGTTEYENEAGQFIVENAGWGTNSFGVTYANGQLTWFQYPGQRSAGDEFMAHLYVVNDETGKYLDFVLNVKYVGEVAAETETVGHASIAHVVTADEADNGVFVVELDTEAMCEALEASADVLEDMTVVAPKSSTIYYKGEFEEKFNFNAAGYYADNNAVLTATPYVEGDKLCVEIDIQELTFGPDSDTSVTICFGFEYNGKRYLYNITLASSEDVVGVASMPASAVHTDIYTVSGIKLGTMQRGLNIVKMSDGSARKVAVK